jgi:hypothetical protein
VSDRIATTDMRAEELVFDFKFACIAHDRNPDQYKFQEMNQLRDRLIRLVAAAMTSGNHRDG